MKMKNFTAAAVAALMLTLVGCGNTNEPSSDADAAASSVTETETEVTTTTVAETAAETTTMTETSETTTTTETSEPVVTTAAPEIPKSPFADGIDTPADGVKLGMAIDDITAMFGNPVFKDEFGSVFYYNTDSVTVFGETYSAASSLEFAFDNNALLSCVVINLGGQFAEDGLFERTGTYSAEQQKSDYDEIYAAITEKVGEPTDDKTYSGGSNHTWSSEDLETDPTGYLVDEGAVDGLYANYIKFYVSDSYGRVTDFSSLLTDEEIAARKMSGEDAAAAEAEGGSMAFAQIEECIYRALRSHEEDPFTTEDEGYKLGEAVAADLEAGGFVFGDYTGDNFYNNGGRFSNVSPTAQSTGTYKTPYSPLTISEAEGLTLKEVAIEKLVKAGSFNNYFRVSLEYSIDDSSDVAKRDMACAKLFTYLVKNGYKDAEDAADKLSDALRFFEDGGEGKSKFCKFYDDKFNKIEVTTYDQSVNIIFYK